MDNWQVIAIIVTIFLFIVGTFSTVSKNAKTPLRKKGLNDLKETLPRNNKKSEKTSFTRK